MPRAGMPRLSLIGLGTISMALLYIFAGRARGARPPVTFPELENHLAKVPPSFVEEDMDGLGIFPFGFESPVDMLLNGTCEGLAEVSVSSWMYRYGNNLIQLVNAIWVAKVAGIPQVNLPATGGARDLLKLPEMILLEDNAEDIAEWWSDTFTCDCQVWRKRRHFVNICKAKCPGLAQQVASHNMALRTIMLEVLWPYARPEYMACEEPDETTLTIHGRYGDLGAFRSSDGHAQGKLLPCAFYDHLIDTFAFKKVIFLAEERDISSRDHPCIELLEARQDISLKLEGSLAEATCNIVKASNVVIPRSSLSSTLVFANRRVQRIFAPQKRQGLGSQTSITPHTGNCHLPVEFHEYDIDGFETVRSGEDKLHYMLSDKDSLTINALPKKCLV